MTHDQPKPRDIHFQRKLRTVASIEELRGFKNALIDFHGSLTREETEAIARRRAELERQNK